MTVTEGLVNPWGLTFLPDGKMLVTEKPGRLRVVSADGKQLSEPVAGLPAVDARGQGGLLDVALDPAFADQSADLLELRRAGRRGHEQHGGGSWPVRGRRRAEGRERAGDLPPGAVAGVAAALRRPAGLRPDGTLFVTLGDRSITPGRMQAQHMDSLIGKIVRLNADGSMPKDNPFVGKPGVRPEIWSFGHRNVQAATLHPATGELWEVEHGTRGGDELNVSRKGKDYGWPTIAYGIEYQGGPITGGIQQKDGMEQPRYYWDPVIAPSGMVFYTGRLFPAWQNSLFIGGMGSTNLVRLRSRATGDGRGASAAGSAAEPRAHPRRAAGARRRTLPPHRQREGTDPEDCAEVVSAVTPVGPMTDRYNNERKRAVFRPPSVT